MVTPKISNFAIDFKVDIGHNLSQAFPAAKLRPSDKIMRTYTINVIKTCGMITCTVKNKRAA